MRDPVVVYALLTIIFSGDVISSYYGPLRSARQVGENFCFLRSFQIEQRNLLLLFSPFYRVLTFRFTCFHTNQ